MCILAEGPRPYTGPADALWIQIPVGMGYNINPAKCRQKVCVFRILPIIGPINWPLLMVRLGNKWQDISEAGPPSFAKIFLLGRACFLFSMIEIDKICQIFT